MLADKEKERYSRQMMLPEIGITGQERLKAAKVLVVGAGGLGCAALPYLAAAGVGAIGIIDGDNIAMSNLQRQVLYTEHNIGAYKAIIAAEKLRSLNPNIQVNAYTEWLTKQNALDIIAQYDVVVDGTDNFEGRYLVNDACVILGKPFVFGSIFRFEGQVAVLNFKGSATYRCLFPQPPADGETLNCEVIGVTAPLPGIIGSIQANETIKLITGAGEPLAGKLLVLDSLTMQSNIYTFSPINANLSITTLDDYTTPPVIPKETITRAAMQQLIVQNIPLQLVDVRETEEHEIENIGGINIPYSQFMVRLTELKPDNVIILYCSGGARSAYLAKILRQKGFTHSLSLEGGMG